MTPGFHLLRWLYGWLIRWYPPRFRAEFNDEMELVFMESLHESASGSLWSQVSVLGRELKDMPVSILAAYWREKKGFATMSAHEHESRISPWAMLTIAVFFILLAIYEIIDIPGSLTENAILKVFFPLVFLTILFGPFVVGVFMRLPRWSMIFAGLPLAILAIYIVNDAFGRQFESQILSWMRQVLSPSNLPNRILWQWINQGRFWLAIGITALVVIGVIALIPYFRSFAKEVWQDWTLISFLFYGASVLIFFIDFDEYRYDGWYRLGCMASMAAGAWGYLRAGTPLRRTSWLLAGITVCMAIMGVGKYFLVPLQDWSVWFSRHPAETERWFESLRTIATWFWMALFIGLPGFGQSLRRSAPASAPVEPAAQASSPAR